MTNWLWVRSQADAPTPWQMGFQDPATAAMEGIVDLHHDICFFLITILVLVLWLGVRILAGFHHTRQPVPERFNHHTTLELVWAILPSLIVTLIALPSLTLIYTFDDLVARPSLTVKVIGRQWYWSYEMKEHVQYSLANPSKLLDLSSVLPNQSTYEKGGRKQPSSSFSSLNKQPLFNISKTNLSTKWIQGRECGGMVDARASKALSLRLCGFKSRHSQKGACLNEGKPIVETKKRKGNITKESVFVIT